MVNDTIADLLTRIRNAQRAGFSSVRVPASRLVKSVLDVLKEEGFVGQIEAKTAEDQAHRKEFEVALKYDRQGHPAIEVARRVSRSGRRVYVQSEKLPHVRSGLGVAIVSTSQGVMVDREARRRKIGGEVLAMVS